MKKWWIRVGFVKSHPKGGGTGQEEEDHHDPIEIRVHEKREPVDTTEQEGEEAKQEQLQRIAMSNQVNRNHAIRAQ